jgi:two-component system response regulator QseB
MHVLMVEDDLDLGRALLQGLKAEGITTEWMRRAADALLFTEYAGIDCVLLDLSLPDGTGHQLLSQWRRSAILGSSSSRHIRRLRSDWRALTRAPTISWSSPSRPRETYKPKSHLVRVAGRSLNLSPREFRLLLELCRVAGTVVSKDVRAQRLEPLGDPVDFGAIEVHVSNLRRRVGAQRIRTVRGVGYMLVL